MMIFLSAGFGALLQEILYWYSLRQRLPHDKFVEITRSYAAWLIGVAMILGSATFVFVWFLEATETVSIRNALLMGAAMPTLFKQFVSAYPSRTELGGTTKKITRNYFRIN